MADLALAPAVAPPTRVPLRRRDRPSAASRTLRAVALIYVAVLVLLPLLVLIYRTFQPGLGAFFDALTDPLALHAFEVTAVVALVAVAINTVFGVVVALLMARYRFPGKRLLSAFVDLPVAVSPIIVGLALVLVFGYGGWFGPTFTSGPFQVIGAKVGMVLATVFVSLPLVVRAVLPVLEQAGTDQEVAATSLGATAFTCFRRITLPTIRAALTYGVVLSLARGIGEYGAVLVVSGNINGQTETAPLRIDNLLTEDQARNPAYVLAFVLILLAVVAILLSAYIRRRQAS